MESLFAEAVSKDERAAITAYSKTLKAWLKKNYPESSWRVSTSISANPNPWITAQAEKTPNSLRQLIIDKIFGGKEKSGVQKWDDISYGNVQNNRLALHLSEWKKITGDSEDKPVSESHITYIDDMLKRTINS